MEDGCNKQEFSSTFVVSTSQVIKVIIIMSDSTSGSNDSSIEQEGIDPKNLEINESRNEETSESRKRSHEEENTPHEDQPSFKRQRFEALSEEKQHLWELPEVMEEYARKYFVTYVKEKDLRDTTLIPNPVPENFLETPSLDPYYQELMEERRRRLDISQDNIYKKIQERVRNTMGPLCKLWFRIEESIKDPGIDLDLEELAQYIEQTVLLNGQAFNAISHIRRINVLTSVGQENNKAKDNLKEHCKLLEKSAKEKQLFGSEFRKVIKEKAKAKKDSKEVYKPKHWTDNSGNTNNNQNKRPFQRGPSASFPKNTEGRSNNNNNKNQNGGRRNGFSARGKNFNFNAKRYGKIAKASHGGTSQQYSFHSVPRTSPIKQVKVCTSTCTKTISKPRNRELSVSRKVKIFPFSVEKNYKQPRSVTVGIRTKSGFPRKTTSAETPSSDRDVKGRKGLSSPGSGSYVGKRCYPKSSGSEGSISQQYF